MREDLVPVREKVLDRAWLAEGETLLDVGCGEGMIGFGALERGAGHVVFSDISDDLLDFCREAADGLGVSSAAASSTPAPTPSCESTTRAPTSAPGARC